MKTLIGRLVDEIKKNKLTFAKKPLLIGGMAMEYYDLRKSGDDIDLVICNEDYQRLAAQYPEKRKDIWGDLGVVIGLFEIWRSINLLDYEFYIKDAIEEDCVFVVSIDKLLLMRVFAMDIKKYMDDLLLLKDYFYKIYKNIDYEQYQFVHIDSYKQSGTVFGGKYIN